MVQGDEAFFLTLFGLGEKGEQVTAEKPAEEQLDIEDLSDREEVKKIPIDQIVPNRFQPRTVFDDEKIEELSRTIHTHGIIQPIVVREFEDGQFEIIAGERRYRAMKRLGWEEAPAIVKI